MQYLNFVPMLAALILAFCLPALADNDTESDPVSVAGKQRLIKLHYHNDNGEKGLTTFYYDDRGLMYRAKWELLDGSRSSQNYHTFDAVGNWTRKYREFSDGLTSNVDYTFDKDNRLVSERFERSDSVQGVTSYTYDEAGRILSADCHAHHGWFNGTINFDHDESGRKIAGNLVIDGSEAGKISYAYDVSDSLSVEEWTFSGGWSQTFEYESEPISEENHMTYSSSNVFVQNTGKFRLVKENYDYSGKMGGPSHFEYDESGRLVKKTFERNDGLKTETTFEYDSLGRLISSLRNYPNGLTGAFKYEYDGNNRLVHRTFERSDGVTGDEHYDYDPKGLLREATYKPFDNWLNGTIHFENDDNGFLKTGTFKGDDGFDADITFENDKHGNVTRIHWELTNGATQTYTFEYEAIKR